MQIRREIYAKILKNMQNKQNMQKPQKCMLLLMQICNFGRNKQIHKERYMQKYAKLYKISKISIIYTTFDANIKFRLKCAYT